MLQNTSPTLGINLDSKVLLPQESTLCRVGLGLSVGSYIPASDLEDGIYTKLPSPPPFPPPPGEEWDSRGPFSVTIVGLVLIL